MAKSTTDIDLLGSNTGGSLHERVLHIVNLIRPAVQADGGDLELVGVTPDGRVQVRFHGACVGCPSSTMTLQVGIERSLKERVPEVTGVEAVS
jgi:Fe-S cluster biogenesis protein NfuA